MLEVVFDDGLDAVDHVAGAEYCLCVSKQSVRCDGETRSSRLFLVQPSLKQSFSQ